MTWDDLLNILIPTAGAAIGVALGVAGILAVRAIWRRSHHPAAE